MGVAESINIRHRLTQVVVFFACIMICMMISQFAEAGRPPKPPRFDKPKYRVSVYSNSHKVVKILQKKRADYPKSSGLFASGRKSKKAKAMAETDM